MFVPTVKSIYSCDFVTWKILVLWEYLFSQTLLSFSTLSFFFFYSSKDCSSSHSFFVHIVSDRAATDTRLWSWYHLNSWLNWLRLPHFFPITVIFFNVMTANSQFPTFLIANIGSLISVLLENYNYLLWKSLFLPVLRANGLIGFVDRTTSCPSQFVVGSNGASELNPKFSKWVQHNQNVLCWINATLPHVVGLTTSREV